LNVPVPSRNQTSLVISVKLNVIRHGRLAKSLHVIIDGGNDGGGDYDDEYGGKHKCRLEHTIHIYYLGRSHLR